MAPFPLNGLCLEHKPLSIIINQILIRDVTHLNGLHVRELGLQGLHGERRFLGPLDPHGRSEPSELSDTFLREPDDLDALLFLKFIEGYDVRRLNGCIVIIRVPFHDRLEEIL